MKRKKLNNENELALTIMEKCHKLGCKGANDTAELLGCATLIILNTIGAYLGCSFDEMRKEYIRGLSEAEIDER